MEEMTRIEFFEYSTERTRDELVQKVIRRLQKIDYDWEYVYGSDDRYITSNSPNELLAIHMEWEFESTAIFAMFIVG